MRATPEPQQPGQVCVSAALPAGGSRAQAPGVWSRGRRLQEGTVHHRPAAPEFTLRVPAAREAEWARAA